MMTRRVPTPRLGGCVPASGSLPIKKLPSSEAHMSPCMDDCDQEFMHLRDQDGYEMEIKECLPISTHSLDCQHQDLYEEAP